MKFEYGEKRDLSDNGVKSEYMKRREEYWRAVARDRDNRALIILWTDFDENVGKY